MGGLWNGPELGFGGGVLGAAITSTVSAAAAGALGKKRDFRPCVVGAAGE